MSADDTLGAVFTDEVIEALGKVAGAGIRIALISSDRYTERRQALEALINAGGLQANILIDQAISGGPLTPDELRQAEPRIYKCEHIEVPATPYLERNGHHTHPTSPFQSRSRRHR